MQQDRIGRIRAQHVVVDGVELNLQRPVNSASHLGAGRLGRAETAMRAGVQLGVRQAGSLDGALQAQLERPNALGRGRPAPDYWRLDDDALDTGGTIKHPRRLGGTHSRSGVVHQLLVFLRVNGDAITELPVDDVGSVTHAAQHITGTEGTGQELAKAHTRFNGELHLLIRVNGVQQVESRLQLLVDHLLVENLPLVVLADQFLGEFIIQQHLADGVVQQGALVGVGAAWRRWRQLHQGHAAGAVHHALGGRAADDCRVFHSAFSTARS